MCQGKDSSNHGSWHKTQDMCREFNQRTWVSYNLQTWAVNLHINHGHRGSKQHNMVLFRGNLGDKRLVFTGCVWVTSGTGIFHVQQQCGWAAETSHVKYTTWKVASKQKEMTRLCSPGDTLDWRHVEFWSCQLSEGSCFLHITGRVVIPVYSHVSDIPFCSRWTWFQHNS